MKEWAEEVGKLSEGRIQIQVYPAAAIKGREILEAVSNGSIEWLTWSPLTLPVQLPLHLDSNCP
jgi:TRAP-type C4-dicarboxylate transport system substrate-binding protein